MIIFMIMLAKYHDDDVAIFNIHDNAGWLVTHQEISCHWLLLCSAKKRPKKSPQGGYMAHTPDDDSNVSNDSENKIGIKWEVPIGNLYDKIPHVALEVEADQQGWVRSWEFK